MFARSNHHFKLCCQSWTTGSKLYYNLISPTDDKQAVSLVFTQRFSVGHFCSPYHTITESIFCKFFINANKSISYKHWVSISSKSLVFTQLGQFGPQYTSITRLRLRIHKTHVEHVLRGFFRFLSPLFPHMKENSKNLRFEVSHLGINHFFM